jgi:hypothetical protein
VHFVMCAGVCGCVRVCACVSMCVCVCACACACACACLCVCVCVCVCVCGANERPNNRQNTPAVLPWIRAPDTRTELEKGHRLHTVPNLMAAPPPTLPTEFHTGTHGSTQRHKGASEKQERRCVASAHGRLTCTVVHKRNVGERDGCVVHLLTEIQMEAASIA